VSRARRILFAERACNHAILLAANSFLTEFRRYSLEPTPPHIVLSAGSLMMKSGLPSCWMHSKLPPSHPRVLS
jgi:hypothetical protein